jgi:hypothetical protein
MKYCLFILSLLFHTYLLSQKYSDRYYSEIIKSEECLINASYKDAINSYNRALQIKSLPTHTLNNYINLLKEDTSLLIKYLDTILHFSFLHGSYESVRQISNRLNIDIKNLESKFGLNQNYLLSKEFVYKVDSIVEEDQRIRRESRNKNKGKIYTKESILIINQIDSINLINIFSLMNDSRYKHCLGYAIDGETLALWQHILGKVTDSTKLRSEKLIEIKAREGLIDKYYSSEILHSFYATNTRHHKIDSLFLISCIAYNTPYMLVFERNEKVVNNNRNRWGLEPLSNHIKKTIWNKENDKFFFTFLLNSTDNIGKNLVECGNKINKNGLKNYYYFVPTSVKH